MARRSSTASILRSVARSAARAQRQYEADQRRRQREQERQQKQRERELRKLERVRLLEEKEAKKAAKQQHLEDRLQEVEDLNQELAERIQELQTILEHTLTIDDTIAFESLRVREDFRPFAPPKELTAERPAPKKEAFLARVPELSFFQKLVPGAAGRRDRRLKTELQRFQEGLAEHREQEAERKNKLAALKAEYDREYHAFQLKVEQRNKDVDELESAYRALDPDAVVAYNTMVLERSSYPDGFPQEFRVAYLPDSKELVIEYELPGVDIVPQVASYTYVKTRDAITEKARKHAEVNALYADLVAATALRTIHEVLEADQVGAIEVVVFNGFVQSTDPATGKDVRPHLVSVRTTRERFQELELARVEKTACLKNLGAQVSPKPGAMQPVKPVVEFAMVDRRFVEQSDILTDLESRPNLMELNPFEFENLVANLFSEMGLETKQTRSSRDGGVDAIAFDTRPVLGGKVVIQAKRYKNTVGVAAVRDLYGTMMNEGANKGILVTTSSYGPDAYDFANDKPIELIDGGGLLYLLDQVGVQARIVLPS